MQAPGRLAQGVRAHNVHNSQRAARGQISISRGAPSTMPMRSGAGPGRGPSTSYARPRGRELPWHDDSHFLRPSVIALVPVGAVGEETLRDLLSVIGPAFHCVVELGAGMPFPARRTIRRADNTCRQRCWTRSPPRASLDGSACSTSPTSISTFPASTSCSGRRMRHAGLPSEGCARFLHRVAVEAVHELGHTWGLDHCRDPTCVMWFSNTLAETDRKTSTFCPLHRRRLSAAQGRDRAPSAG
ncbi:MAG: hypothetical protein DMF77_07340 [Acidobacteria bacterium]|nr:MAG: hypothetical protein DMF77_07340 [Acidobacteriota bacterium]